MSAEQWELGDIVGLPSGRRFKVVRLAPLGLVEINPDTEEFLTPEQSEENSAREWLANNPMPPLKPL